MSRKTKKRVAGRIASAKRDSDTDTLHASIRPVPAILALAAFIIPLAASTSVSWPFSLPKLAALGVLAFATLIALCVQQVRSGGSPRFAWALLPVGGLVLWVGLATVTSVNPAISVLGKYGRYDGLLTLCSYMAIFWVAFQHLWSRRELETLAIAVVAAAVLVSAYAVLQFVGIDPLNWGTVRFESNRAFSTFGNPALLSGYLVLTLFVAVGLALQDRYPLLSLAAAALIALALFTTLTRGGWVAGILGLVVLGVSLARLGRFRSIVVYSLATLAFLAVIAVGLSLVSSARPGAVAPMDRVKGVLLASGTAAERIEIWKAAVAATAARPISGWGPDNFRVAFAQYQTRAYVSRLGGGRLEDNAHNYPLQLAATAGVPAALLFLAACGWAMLLGIRKVFDGNHFLLLGMVTGLIAYFINILFTVNVVGSAFLFWLLLGVTLSISTNRQAAPAAVGAPVGHAIWCAGLLAVGLVLAVVPLAEFGADYNFTRARGIASAASLEAALPDYDKAFAMNPWVDKYRFALGQAYFNRGRDAGTAADFALASRQFEAARVINPDEVDNLLFLAQVDIFSWEQEVGGDLSMADNNLDNLLALQPLSPSARYLKALIYRDQGDSARSAAILMEALRIYPGYEDARQLLSTLEGR